MATPETTTDTTRRHHCPMCQGPMDPGSFFCSRLCGAVAELRSEMDEVTAAAHGRSKKDRAHSAGYIAGLRRALNVLVPIAPAGNPLAVKDARPGDQLYRRTTATYEYLVVRSRATWLEAWAVRDGKITYSGPVLAAALESHGWEAIGAFRGPSDRLSFVPDGEVGHA